MKKLLTLSIILLGVVAQVSAKRVAVDVGDCPMPCCEKQEMITVRHKAKPVCGFVCPDGTYEVENND